jgi:hypothetical protein
MHTMKAINAMTATIGSTIIAGRYLLLPLEAEGDEDWVGLLAPVAHELDS